MGVWATSRGHHTATDVGAQMQDSPLVCFVHHNSIIPDMVGFSQYPSTRISWFTIPYSGFLNSFFFFISGGSFAHKFLHKKGLQPHLWSNSYTSSPPQLVSNLEDPSFLTLVLMFAPENSTKGMPPLQKVLQFSSRTNDGFCGTKEKILCGVSKQQHKPKSPTKTNLTPPQTLMKC